MLKLVIADDEITIRRGLATLVASFGLPITIAGAAADGREALALFEQQRPELMLVDINMPHLNGLDLVEQTLALLPQSKVIIISGYDQFDYARRALQLGVFDYLLKPISRGALYQALSKAIQAYEQRLVELNRLNLQPAPAEAAGSIDPVEEALGMIQQRYADPDLSLAALANALHVSSANLSRGLKQRTGKNFSEYLTALRMEQAIALLSAPGSVMIYNVADQVGYSSQHYFCRIFKEYTGKTPSEWRKNIIY